MRTVMNNIRNHMRFAPPEAMPGFGGGSGTNDGGQRQSGQGDEGDDSHSNIPLYGEEGESTSDLDEALAMFNSNQGDDDDGELNDTEITPWTPTEIPNSEVETLQQGIRQAISQMRVPDNMIPEDFDPSDRGQLQQLLNQTLQAAVTQSMGVVFRPVQMAMNHLNQQIDGRIDSAVRTSRTQSQAQDIIESMVPEFQDKRYKTMLEGLDSTLKAQKKTPRERAVALRKILNQMGIKSTQGSDNSRRQSGSGGQGNGSGVKVGTAALDSFFGKMARPAGQK